MYIPHKHIHIRGKKSCLKMLKHLGHLKAQNIVNQDKYGLKNRGMILVKHESTEQENTGRVFFKYIILSS